MNPKRTEQDVKEKLLKGQYDTLVNIGGEVNRQLIDLKK